MKTDARKTWSQCTLKARYHVRRDLPWETKIYVHRDDHSSIQLSAVSIRCIIAVERSIYRAESREDYYSRTVIL